MITCTFEDGGKGSLRHVTVNALVIKDNKILLVKRAPHLSAGGKYAIPGGFMDRDETLEACAKRELLEETGYKAENVTLFRVNDNPNRRGEDRQNVDFVYLITGSEKVGEADAESTEVAWFSLDKLPSQEDFAFDHLETIHLYLDYVKENFPLPILPK